MANVITRHDDLVFVHTDTNCRAHPSRVGRDVFHSHLAALSVARAANRRLHVKQYRVVVREGHFRIQVVES